MCELALHESGLQAPGFQCGRTPNPCNVKGKLCEMVKILFHFLQNTVQ